MPATLPLRQLAVLRYLEDAAPRTAGEVTKALQTDRTATQNALRLLAAKGLVTGDLAWPASFTITGEGRKALATAEGGES